MASPTTYRVKRFRDVPEARVKYERAAEFALDVAKGLAEGDRVHALLSGNFIFGDFLEALAVENGVHFNRLTLSTLAISDENVVSLANMRATGWLDHLDMIVSSYFWSHNRHNAPFLYEQLVDTHKSRIAVAGIHTKVALIDTGKSKLVISGSANLRSSRTVECVTIENDPGLFDFHDEWHQNILADYQVTKREKRAGALWSQLNHEQE